MAADAAESEWLEALELKFLARRRLAHAALPSMVKNGYGRIITVTGSSEPNPYPLYGTGTGRSNLNAANSAVGASHAWAKGLSREVGRFGITVNSVAPPSIASEQIAKSSPMTTLAATTSSHRSRWGDSVTRLTLRRSSFFSLPLSAATSPAR